MEIKHQNLFTHKESFKSREIISLKSYISMLQETYEIFYKLLEV